MDDTPTPIWRPVSFLSTYTELIDGTLEEAKDQLALLEQARPKPYGLDDATVTRIILFGLVPNRLAGIHYATALRLLRQ